MVKTLLASTLLIPFVLALTASGQELDEAVVAKAAQESLLMMPDPPLGFAIAKHPLSVQGKLVGFQIQVIKDSAISKVLISVAFGDFSERPARQAAYKGYINGFAKGLASEGFKMATNKFPDIEKTDFKTPVVADLTFANDKGTNLLVQKRIFFTTKAYDITAIGSDEADFKLLSTWASKVRPAPPPTASSSASGSSSSDAKNGASDELQTAISEAIRILEAKDYVGFFNNFVPPDDVKMITKNGSLDDIAKQFGETKAPRLLQVLKAAKTVKPTLDPTGTKAVFEVEGKSPLKLTKVAKRWYLQN